MKARRMKIENDNEIPNRKTIAALKECNKKLKLYTNMDDIVKELHK